jgi:hypothetical protein
VSAATRPLSPLEMAQLRHGDAVRAARRTPTDRDRQHEVVDAGEELLRLEREAASDPRLALR